MTDKTRIRTIVVEDEEKILNNICARIESLDDSFEIVAKAENGQEAIEKVERFRPQVVFTDISMPVMGGMELIREIRQVNPSTVIVIISGYSDFSYAREAIKYSVFNYMLKPLDDESLAETLFDIRQRLSYLGPGRKRQIVYSDNYQLLSDMEEEYYVGVVCLGNVIYDTTDETVNSFYACRMKNMYWDEIMREVCAEGEEWMIIDEHAVNQKIIEIKAGQGRKADPGEISEMLMRAVRGRTELPVNICAARQFVVRNELQDFVKRIRNVLRQHLVVGEQRVFYLEEEEKAKNEVIEIVKLKLNQYIKQYYISADLETFLGEAEMIFKYMKSNHASQSTVEKICIYVLRLLEFSKQGYDKDLLDDLGDQMIAGISISLSEEELFENLLQEFKALIHCQASENEEYDEETVLDYVNERYLTIESLEEVAEHFGYNYAYLSRIFKKKAGMSMSRYITQKKIGLAKELIETKPEMRLGEISDMCGYNDSRYFSRVFKAETGCSPSEYKEKKRENGNNG